MAWAGHFLRNLRTRISNGLLYRKRLPDAGAAFCHVQDGWPTNFAFMLKLMSRKINGWGVARVATYGFAFIIVLRAAQLDAL